MDVESMVRGKREERWDHAVETEHHGPERQRADWKNQTKGHGRVPGEARVRAWGRPT